MTEQDINDAFAVAVENKELKDLDIDKFKRYHYTNHDISLEKKLHVLFLLGKIRLS